MTGDSSYTLEEKGSLGSYQEGYSQSGPQITTPLIFSFL